MALVHGSASTRPPAADAATPLRSLAPATEAKLATRAAAGLPAIGADYPRRRVWQRVVMPSGGLAVLDLLGVIVGFARGQVLLAIVRAGAVRPVRGHGRCSAPASPRPTRCGWDRPRTGRSPPPAAGSRVRTGRARWPAARNAGSSSPRSTPPNASPAHRPGARDASTSCACTSTWPTSSTRSTSRPTASRPRAGSTAAPIPARPRLSTKGWDGRRRPRRGADRLRRRARQLRATSPRGRQPAPATPSARPCPAAPPGDQAASEQLTALMIYLGSNLGGGPQLRRNPRPGWVRRKGRLPTGP